ncbi:MAG: PDC sensor domain-containing protein, partial [Planctomycetota bacterium]
TLLDRERGGTATETDAGDHGETVAAARPMADTLGPLPPVPGPAPTASSLPKPRRLVTLTAIAGAVGLVFFLGLMVRQQQAKLQRVLEDKLASVAPPLASALADEINDRFNLLRDASKSPELLRALEPIDAVAAAPRDNAATKPTPAERALWAPLQDWLTNQRRNATEESNLNSSSWFVTDRFGRQVARHPRKDTTGKWYEDRDYFHGQGEIEQGATPPPIAAPHKSAVYRSSNTKVLKVAFSAPIYDAERERVIGVLAMSLNLGDFRVLENAEQIKPPMEVVLVDMRNDVPRQHGWLLHHRELRELEDDTNPFKLPSTLLERVDAAMQPGIRRGDGRLREPIFRSYGDLLNRPGKGEFVG